MTVTRFTGRMCLRQKGPKHCLLLPFYATGANTQYEVYVVHDFENEKSFAQREQLASGTLQKAGYYTVDFDTKVSLKKGNVCRAGIPENTRNQTSDGNRI